MPKACDLKKGNVVEINDAPYIVKHIDVRTPSARGAVTLYKIRFNNIKTKQKYEESYKGNDMLNEVDLRGNLSNIYTQMAPSMYSWTARSTPSTWWRVMQLRMNLSGSQTGWKT